MRSGNSHSNLHGVLKWRGVVMLACAVCLTTGCGPDPNGDSPVGLPRTQTAEGLASTNRLTTALPDRINPSRRNEMSADKVRQAVRNISSYLVDLEGSLRAGAGDQFVSNASDARAILGNIRYETGLLSQGGVDTATIETRVGTIEAALSSATKESWNNIVSKSKSEILEMQTALKNIGKGEFFHQGNSPDG